jgi:hypothetical protein
MLKDLFLLLVGVWFTSLFNWINAATGTAAASHTRLFVCVLLVVIVMIGIALARMPREDAWPTADSYLRRDNRFPSLVVVVQPMIEQSEFKNTPNLPENDLARENEALKAIVTAARTAQLVIRGQVRGSTLTEDIPADVWRYATLVETRGPRTRLINLQAVGPAGAYRGPPQMGNPPTQDDIERVAPVGAKYDAYIVDAKRIETLWPKSRSWAARLLSRIGW